MDPPDRGRTGIHHWRRNHGIAAVGHVIHFGSSSWLGNIIVREGFRKQGLGTIVTKSLISLCRSGQPILLVATEMGFRVYSKLGFTTSSTYCFFRGGTVDGKGLLNVKPATQDDSSLILNLDEQVTGETRGWLLLKHLSSALVIKHPDNGDLRGFYLPDCGAGTIAATDTEAGIELLKYKLYHHPEKQLCIPE